MRTNKRPGTAVGSQNKTTGYVGTLKFVIQLGVELAESGKSNDFYTHTDVPMHLSSFTIKKTNRKPMKNNSSHHNIFIFHCQQLPG